jgi:hypothetical protein
LLKAKVVSLLLHEPMNSQLNFDHLKGPKSLETGNKHAGSTKGGFIEKDEEIVRSQTGWSGARRRPDPLVMMSGLPLTKYFQLSALLACGRIIFSDPAPLEVRYGHVT